MALAVSACIPVKLHIKSRLGGTWTSESYTIVAFDEEGFPFVYDYTSHRAVYLHAVMKKHHDLSREVTVEVMQ